MSKIFFDIETVPTNDYEVRAMARDRARRIAEAKGEDYTSSSEEAIEKFAPQNAIYSRIVSIAWAVDNGEVNIVTGRDFSEAQMLSFFADAISAEGPHLLPTLVGYNIMAFDNKMLWGRSKIVGVPAISRVLPAPDVAPWQAKNVIDLAIKWQGVAGSKVPQYALAVALGITSKSAADKHGNGGDVLGWVRDCDWDRVIDHNQFDIRVTRAIWRLLFTDTREEVE